MAQDRSATSQGNWNSPDEAILSVTYYQLLDLPPSASPQEIRRAYREKSKLYHPDTTELPTTIATEKFQQLNQAYATLSSPQRRLIYDRRNGYSSIHVVQSAEGLSAKQPTKTVRSSAYLDPSDRPLSPGEIFALFILGLTFVGCLILAIVIGLTRGDITQQVTHFPQVLMQQLSQPLSPTSSAEPVVSVPAIPEPTAEPPSMQEPIQVKP